MTAFKSLSDEYSSQVGEDEGLDEGYHYFNQVDENRKGYGQWRKSPSGNSSRSVSMSLRARLGKIAPKMVCKCPFLK